MSMTSASIVSRLVLAGLLCASVAACAKTSTAPKPENLDYRQNHPIQVASEPVSVSVSVPFEGVELSAKDSAKFRNFLRDFVTRGRAPIMVESTQPERIRDVLIANGLRAGEFTIVTETTIKAPNAILGFTANKVVAPECGDWSSRPSWLPDNAPHSNYGCAMQRNIGQMTANPGDLMQAKPVGGGNASRSDTGIFNHQGGAQYESFIEE